MSGQAAVKVSVRLLPLVALALLLLYGCTPQNSVSGTVSYNGEPVETGSIAFLPADGKGAGFGAQIVDGRFTAQEKVQPGSYVVSVRGVNQQAVPQSTEEAIRQYEEAKAAGKATLDHYGQRADYIPEDAAGNNQTIDVQAGEQMLDFALTGPPRAK